MTGCIAATIWGRLLCEPRLLTGQMRYICDCSIRVMAVLEYCMRTNFQGM